MKRYPAILKKAAAAANIDEATLRNAFDAYDADASLIDDFSNSADEVAVLTQKLVALKEKFPVERIEEGLAHLTQAKEALTTLDAIIQATQ